MTEGSPRERMVWFWWEKGRQSLESARRELGAGALSFAINRAYYALFYAVSAALLEAGHAFKKYSGVRAAFHREFVKTGKMTEAHGELYNTQFDAEYVADRIERCKVFLDELRSQIRSLQQE